MLLKIQKWLPIISFSKPLVSWSSLTSLTKMAADFSSEIDSGVIMEILSSVDPEIRDILCQIDRLTTSEITEKLAERFDTKILLKTREALFRAAMDKIDLCLSQVAKARDENLHEMTEDEEAMIAKAEQLLRGLTPKDMIQRKCLKKLIGDIMDIMTFTGGSEKEFPVRMLRPSTTFMRETNSHESSIAEAIAYLQHVANLTQNDDQSLDTPCTQSGMYGADMGECSDLEISKEMFRTEAEDKGDEAPCNEGTVAPSAPVSSRNEVKSDPPKKHSVKCMMPSEIQVECGEDTEKAESQDKEVCINRPAVGKCVYVDLCQEGALGHPESIYPSSNVNHLSYTTGDQNTTSPMIKHNNHENDHGSGEHEGCIDSNIVITQVNDNRVAMGNAGPSEYVYIPASDITTEACVSDSESVPMGHTSMSGGYYEVLGESSMYANNLETAPANVVGQMRADNAPKRDNDCVHVNQCATCDQCERDRSHSNQDTGEAQVTLPSENKKNNDSTPYPNPLDFPSINISIQCGDFSAVFDIADIVKMASYSKRTEDASSGDDRPAARRRVDCRGCEQRLNAQDRRLDAMEEVVSEQLRRMRIHGSSTLEDEGNGRRVSDISSMPTLAAPNTRAGVTNRHPMAETAAVSLCTRATLHTDRRGRSNNDHDVRERAASFAGNPSRTTSSSRAETALRNQREPSKRNQYSEGAGTKAPMPSKASVDCNSADAPAPKPQRQKRKGKPRQAEKQNYLTMDSSRATENPIKDWLSTARKSAQQPATTPAVTRRARVVEPIPPGQTILY